MRLICGLFHLDGRPADSETLAAMAREMVAPGLSPIVRTWCAGPVGLAVVDFSHTTGAGQSLPSSDDGRVLAADVRLDEPRALASVFGGTACDDDLLLAAIGRWDADAPTHVLGDYAFAAWNPGTRTLLCARDAFGIRPFVYTHQPGRLFAFGSFPRAIHGAGLVPRCLDEIALARRLLSAWRSDDTLYEDIHRLASGHQLEVSAKGLRLHRYWQLNRETAGARRITPDDAARELRGLVDEAVRCRMPATGPVAAHLSGGLDSSALAILAAHRLRAEGRNVLGYSFLARGRDGAPTEDETPYVNAVRVQEPDLAWTPIYAQPFDRRLDARMDVDRLLSVEADDPENAICRHAAAQGAHVVLSGWGGDEGPTFNGRGALAEAFLNGHWRYLAEEIEALKRTRGWSATGIVRGEIAAYLMPGPATNLYRRLRRRPASRADRLRDLVTPSRGTRLEVLAAGGLALVPDARENRIRLMSSPHIAERAENWASIGARAGMAFAFPLLDRRVVEFAVSLPSTLFLRGGFRRRVFRDAMEGTLPELIRWRHQKLVPMPDVSADAAEHRDEIVRYLDAAAQHSRVRALFDLDGLRAVAASLPPVNDVRVGTADRTGLSIVLRVLPAIAYVQQHY